MNFNKKISICIFPFIISLLLCTLVEIAVFRTKSPYCINVSIGIGFTLLFWFALFMYDQHRVMAGISDRGANGVMGILLAAMAVGLFFIYAIWGMEYLTLDPIGRINSGLQHRDSLYQSAIAESYNRSFFPSALVNQEMTLRYHTFSCLITNVISKIFKMPCFFVYSYLYPIFFLPLYGYLQYIGILAGKKYFLGRNTLDLSDIVVVTIYNIGLLPFSQLARLGVWKGSFVNSESFVTANVFAILFFILCFHFLKKEKFRNFFLYIGIPITIFILSWTKISVGFLVMVVIMYYFVRKRTKNVKYWFCNLYYLMIFVIALVLFKGGSSSNGGSSKAGFQLFAFMRYCENRASYLCGHYFILALMAIIFIIFDLKNKKYNKDDFVSGKTVWIELIGIVTVCSFLPGMLLDIGGGSAAYFSYFSEIPAMLLLCGHGYLSLLVEKKSSFFKMGMYIVLFVWMFRAMFVNVQAFYFDKKEADISTEINIYESAMEIRTLVGETPEDFTIYLDENAQVLELCSGSISGIYISGFIGCGSYKCKLLS